MKKFLITFIAMVSSIAVFATEWSTDFEASLKKAQNENKLVLLNFSGSDWCGPCIRMKRELFGDASFEKFAQQNLIMVNADFPRLKKNKLSKEQVKHNEALAEKYNRKGDFPLTILFDPSEKVLKQWLGLPKLSPAEFIAQIQAFSKINSGNHMQTFSQYKVMMGSRISISIVHQNENLANSLIASSFAKIQAIENMISSWDPNSQTSAINKNAGISPVKVDPDLFGLIQRSKKISELTQGAFDISFGSIDDGVFHFDGSMKEWPDSQKIKASVQLINYQNIILDPENRTVFLKNKGMKIGFGAIGKGYAAQQVSEYLKSEGITSGVVNAGGDLYCWGQQPDGSPWLISVADPQQANQAYSQLPVSNKAVVTSGNYEKFIEINGEKYCHIIDPRSGYPVKNLRSVTIITNNPELADALATSVFVLGVETGLDMINQLKGVECLILDEKDQLHTSKNIQLN